MTPRLDQWCELCGVPPCECVDEFWLPTDRDMEWFGAQVRQEESDADWLAVEVWRESRTPRGRTVRDVISDYWQRQADDEARAQMAAEAAEADQLHAARMRGDVL